MELADVRQYLVLGSVLVIVILASAQVGRSYVIGVVELGGGIAAHAAWTSRSSITPNAFR